MKNLVNGLIASNNGAIRLAAWTIFSKHLVTKYLAASITLRRFILAISSSSRCCSASNSRWRARSTWCWTSNSRFSASNSRSRKNATNTMRIIYFIFDGHHSLIVFSLRLSCGSITSRRSKSSSLIIIALHMLFKNLIIFIFLFMATGNVDFGNSEELLRNSAAHITTCNYMIMCV